MPVVTCSDMFLSLWIWKKPKKTADIKLLLMLLSLYSLYPGFLLLTILLDPEQVIMRNLPFLHMFSIFAKEGWVHWDRYELGVIFEALDAQPNMSAAGYPPGSFKWLLQTVGDLFMVQMLSWKEHPPAPDIGIYTMTLSCFYVQYFALRQDISLVHTVTSSDGSLNDKEHPSVERMPPLLVKSKNDILQSICNVMKFKASIHF